MAGRPFSEDELMDYVRGAASAGLAGRIEALMARDTGLRAEIALMRGLRPALKGADSSQPPGEFGWRRLEAAIRRGEGQRRHAAAPRRTAVWRIAAAFLGVAVLGQAAYIASISTTVDDAVYRTAFNAAESHVLGIAFAPGATAGETGDLLRAVNARVIDGPSALGLYRVAFGSAESLRDGQARFRTSPLVTLIAEE